MEPGKATSEKQWPNIILEPIQVTGFVINLPSAIGLHVKEAITLSAYGVDPKDLEIRSVFSPTQITVGEIGKPFTQCYNPSAFDGGRLEAKTKRNELSGDIYGRAIYEEEPAMAQRTIEVSAFGFPLSTPLGEITVVDPEVRLVYDAFMNLIQIRERVPTVKRCSGTVTISGSTMTFSAPVPYWIVPTVHLAFITGAPQADVVVASVNPSRTMVTLTAPLSAYTGAITIDGSIGEVVKDTNLTYDPTTYCLIKISSVYDTVVLADLV